jgi:transposase
LVARREDLKTQRAAESNRSRDIQDKSLCRMLEKHLKFLDAQIKQIDQLIEDTISQDQEMSRKRDILVRTKGVGKTSAAILLSCLPELGTISGAAISALAGVAPFNRDSGTLRGKRSIRAGRATARKALYMCALVGSRTNSILKEIYQRLTSKGKPPKVALTALMRKLVVHLNSSLKTLQSTTA